MSVLSSITVYPIKSLPGHALDQADVLSSSALKHDRRLALVDDVGTIVNAKRTADIHRIEAQYIDDVQSVRLRRRGDASWQVFHLTDEQSQLASYCGELLNMRLTLIEDRVAGLPDDSTLPGPTVVARSSLAAVADWFNLKIDDVRARFRANLEIDDVEPFWEDRLLSVDDRGRLFRIGEVDFAGVNPCARCVVPTRDPHSGSIRSGFAKEFAERRAATLPSWAVRERFDHYYRLSVNTRLAPSSIGGSIRIGDAIELIARE